MQMIACPNCGKLNGLKRALGFGTFFVVLLTCDLSPAVSKAENGASTPASVVYSVAQINAHRNNIPTGTALVVRGIYGSPHVSGGWAPSTELGDDGWVVPTKLDPCSTLLYGGTVRVQHGEASPKDYCQFSLILQDENTSQIQYLECVMSLEGARAAMHKYAYGDRVQAHGRYASSLDFHIMPTFLGDEFGVPVLEDCTLTPLSPPSAPTGPTWQELAEPTTSTPAPAPVAEQPVPTGTAARPSEEGYRGASQAAPPTQPATTAEARTDGQIEMDVLHALGANSALRDSLIAAATAQGEVTLSGTVPNESCRELAELIVKYVPGVGKVNNNLMVGVPQGGGNGYGPGYGGNAAGGVYQVGGRISAPVPIYQPEAEFSDRERGAPSTRAFPSLL